MQSEWLKKVTEGLGSLGRLGNESREAWESDGPRNASASIWRGLAGHSPEMADVQEEVAADQMGRLALVSRRAADNTALLARLREDAPVTPQAGVCYEGFFTLVQLGDPQNGMTPDNGHWEGDLVSEQAAWTNDELTGLLSGADLLLYLFRAEDDWAGVDAQWTARLRAVHAPLLPVLMHPAEVDGGELDALCARLRAKLGVRPVRMLCAPPHEEEAGPPPDLLELVERVLALRPRLAIPLAQESPSCRAVIARRVIRTGAWMSGLLGMEPIPLLDLPLHVAVQWKVALQLAAIYGRPGLDVRSREMMSTLLVSASVRFTAQQLIKLIPLVGWVLSGLLSGVSTWLLGTALVRYYEQERLLTVPRLKLAQWKEGVAPHLAAVHWPRRRKAK